MDFIGRNKCRSFECFSGRYSAKAGPWIGQMPGLQKILTQQVYLVVERELRLTGFWESIPARNKLKAELQKVLLSREFLRLPGIFENRAHIISRIMEIAEKNNDIILYAEG
jgi:hypothetical protein